MTEKMVLAMALVIVALMSYVDAKNILMMPYWNGSHFLEIDGVGRPLLQRGHNVYVLLDEEIAMPKYAPYTLITNRHRLPIAEYFNSNNVHKSIENSRKGLDLSRLSKIVRGICTNMVSDTELLPKLKSLNLDIVIMDNVNLPCFYVLPYKLDIPFVTVGSFSPGYNTRVPILPSVVSPGLGLEILGFHGCEETAEQSRVVKGICRMLSMFVTERISRVEEYEYMREYVDFPSIWELKERAALHLFNHHYLLSDPLPQLPNVEYIGGLTTKPAKALEPSLENWMSEAANVVVVSFGSLIGSLPAAQATKMFDAFAQLTQYRFLFRFKADDSKAYKVASNVRLMDWLPQNDALGHNSTRLFVTHSGNNGQHEALYHGVPMLCFYIHLDQKSNARRVVQRGFGRMIDIHDFTVAELKANLVELMDSLSYSARIKTASAIFHSHLHPAQRAANAVEHIMTYGPDHLRPKEAYELAWWQFYMLDVFAVLYSVLLIIVYTVYKLVKFFIKRLFCSKSHLVDH